MANGTTLPSPPRPNAAVDPVAPLVPVALVIGTRPEAVKLAPVAIELADSRWAHPSIITTGQHGDVVRQTLDLYDLKPEIELGSTAGTDSLAALHASLLTEIDDALGRIQPALVVVQGDTASTLAAAHAAFLRRIPVAYVEAGLRTGDLALPFPEEANRQLVTRLASLHLAPTAAAAANLRRENVVPADIVLTGNTVVDALLRAKSIASPYEDTDLETLDACAGPVVLVTAHRRESWGEPIRRIGRAVARLSRAHPGVSFVVAAHMNPAVRTVLENEVRGCTNVSLPGPIGYGQFVRLLARATIVVTDSGGIQEEAPTFGVPVLVTREVTERSESIAAGVATLVGTDEDLIVAAASRLLTDPVAYRTASRAVSPYGDGQAARRTVEACAWLLGLGPRPSDYLTASPNLPATQAHPNQGADR